MGKFFKDKPRQVDSKLASGPGSDQGHASHVTGRGALSRRRSWFRVALIFASAAGGCASPPSATRSTMPVARTPAPAPALAGTRARGASTRLVVSIVIDQLPSWAVEKYWPHLSEHGVLRHGASKGVFYTHSRFGHATTQTAAGHATIYTGAAPARHGVLANSVWHSSLHKSLAVTDDREHPVLGATDIFASPRVLRSETVADVLERVSEGRAKTVSISLKDRAAIVSGGQRPDAAFWFDHKQPSFTTSTYYEKKLPLWLAAWQSVHPASASLSTWSPRDPALLERLLGPDQGEGEGDWQLLGQAFPHDPRLSKEPYSAFRATPGSTTHLLKLARACIRQYELGGDQTADLLMISVSGTDYVGHVFGPESWEYLDNLQRVDEELGKLVLELEKIEGVRFLITSDHGVAPLPERARAKGRAAERVVPQSLLAALNAALIARATFGEVAPVESFVPPFLYLTAEARTGSMRDTIVGAALEELEKIPGIQRGFDVRVVARSTASEGLEREVADSIPEHALGEIYVVPAQHSVFDVNMPRGAGSNHGSPWPYDAVVPVVFWGFGIETARRSEFVEQARVAATLAALLGVPAPRDAKAKPLTGIPEAAPRSR